MSTADPAGQATPSGAGRRRVVVFDLGGVLIDWDPRHLYRGLFDDADEMERFLAEVATPDWNRQQDAGRSWDEAIEVLAARHPDRRELIEAYRDRWPEMLGGEIPGTVAILGELKAAGVPVYALSNWSAETFPVAVERFPFLALFDAIVISGHVGAAKPDAAIFEHLVREHGIDPAEAVFVDDVPANIEAAARLGFHGLLFRDAPTLRADLEKLGLLQG
jgi:2-haloacid dehalogenase